MSHFGKICVSCTLTSQKKTETNTKPAQIPAVAHEPVAGQYRNQLALPLPGSTFPFQPEGFRFQSLHSIAPRGRGLQTPSHISFSYRPFSSLPSRDIDCLPWVSEKVLFPRHFYPACWPKHYSHFSHGHEDVTPAGRGSGLLPLKASGLDFWQGPWETFEWKWCKSSDLWECEDFHKFLLYLPLPFRWCLPWSSKFFLILCRLGMSSEGKLYLPIVRYTKKPSAYLTAASHTANSLPLWGMQMLWMSWQQGWSLKLIVSMELNGHHQRSQ